MVEFLDQHYQGRQREQLECSNEVSWPSGLAAERGVGARARGSLGPLRYVQQMSYSSHLRQLFIVAVFSVTGISSLAGQDHPANSPSSKPSGSSPEEKTEPLPPLPADASVSQTIAVDGKTLHYTATVGVIPVYNQTDPNKLEAKSGEVVCTSYILDGVADKTDRPVTFALNGGPGAASVYLNFGAIGPKHIQFAEQGDSPSDPARLTDNPGTWLPFSDLVFIDPIGTGFSRSLVAAAETKKFFYSTTPDIEYLSRVIYDWLVKNGRLQSRKYLVGESYGGYRGPRITHYLQGQLGVAMNGVVLVSPYLNPWIGGNGEISPLPWMMTLPAITAAHLEREHQLTADRMKEVIAYTRGQYVTDLLAGRSIRTQRRAL